MISLALMDDIINSRQSVSELKRLYGNDLAHISRQQERFRRLAALFQAQFPGHEQAACFSTPGRTEVGGNHTDHQNGRVLCAAVNLDILAFAAPNKENVIRLKSEGYPQMDVIDLTQLQPRENERGRSAALIRGIAAAFTQQDQVIGGLDIYTTSMVPNGSGLSSSAAFEILVATTLDVCWNQNRLTPVERAKISQYAENAFFGKPCGLMDQCGCSVGGFIAIDFENPNTPLVESLDLDFENSGYGLVITHTGGSHADLTGDYASIPADMRLVAEFFGKSVLREIDESVFSCTLPALRESISDRAVLRAMHFYADNQRVLAQVEALKAGNFEQFMKLVRESGISSWTKLQNIWSVSAPEQQSLALALAVSERILHDQGASRVHGGGFAGTIQAFVPADKIGTYMQEMGQIFGEGASVQLKIRNSSAGEVFLA